jgi:hypothetical protein
MSEIQNKAVALAVQNEGDLASQSPSHRSTLFLEKALDLYFALGGDEGGALTLASEKRHAAPLRVDSAVANVMIEVAVASHLNDIDMVQATYNRLDAELEVPHRPA